MRGRFALLGLAVGYVMLPAAVFAQGGIGGVVRDSSGGVLPGVTVEAASPALIEKVRTVTTDGNGQYLIVDLRPGTYSVTFTLPGFATVRREGLALSAGVTLPVNAELGVSAVEETVTVTGETPVVDIQNTKQETVLGHALLDVMPRSNNALIMAAALPGVLSSTRDVGGSHGEGAGGGNISIHGSRGGDVRQLIDGMQVHRLEFSTLAPPGEGAIEEYTYTVSAGSAETMTGGILISAVPREGGNTFRGVFYGNYTTTGMTTYKIPDDLKTRWGLTSREKMDRIHNFNPAVGGPIVRDRLWFFTSYRNWGTNKYVLDTWYESDPTRPARSTEELWSATLRTTWQASPRNKVAVYGQKTRRSLPFRIGVPSLFTAESATDQESRPWVVQSRWTSPVTSRLLLEAGASYTDQGLDFLRSPASVPGSYPSFEITTGKLSGALPAQWHAGGPGGQGESILASIIGSVAYVTGTHAFKAGFQHAHGGFLTIFDDFPPTLRFNNGVPFQVQFSAVPRDVRPRVKHDLGLYAQDQWKLGSRVTLNLGLRFDWWNARIAAQDGAAGTFNPVPARHFDAIENVPNWKDLNPRVGGVWDLFGNGKTALKASVSRFVLMDSNLAFTNSLNPMIADAGATDLRTWTDRNGDRLPQPDELGPSTNLNFGLPVFRIRPDPSLGVGWGKRGYNWEYSASVQHELRPGLAATVGYYRRAFGNLTWTNNRAVTPSDFTPFTLVSPLDGERITLYNLNPAKRGIIDNVVEFAPNNSEVFDGVDITVNGRFGQGGIINGGVTMGRTVTDSCTVWDPNQLRFCKSEPGFMAQNQYKFIVAYPLPYDLQVSSTFQSLRTLNFGAQQGGLPWIAANYTVTSAIAGVPLTAGTITVPLVEPGTLWPKRLNQLDARLTKTMRVGRTRLQGYVEVFNIFNSAAISNVNPTYGPNWQRPTAVLVGRMAKIGGQIDF